MGLLPPLCTAQGNSFASARKCEKKTQRSFVPQKVKDPLCHFLEVVRTARRSHKAPKLEERLRLPARASCPDAAGLEGVWTPTHSLPPQCCSSPPRTAQLETMPQSLLLPVSRNPLKTLTVNLGTAQGQSWFA